MQTVNFEGRRHRQVPSPDPVQRQLHLQPEVPKENFGDKHVHAFWGKADSGLILSSISPWELKREVGSVRPAKDSDARAAEPRVLSSSSASTRVTW